MFRLRFATNDHDEILLKVIKRLDKFGIKLNEKCQYANDNLNFLGARISSGGIQTDEDKFKSIKSMSVPKYDNFKILFRFSWVCYTKKLTLTGQNLQNEVLRIYVNWIVQILHYLCLICR